MSKNTPISMLAGCTALILGLAALGCGGSDSPVPPPDGSQDLASLSGQCMDACTLLMLHADVGDADMEVNITLCHDSCMAPGDEQDILERDCSIACDPELPRMDYLNCQCECGITGVCDLASPEDRCADTCATLMVCAEELTDVIPDAFMLEHIAMCYEDCTDPGDAADVAIRDCALGCDVNETPRDWGPQTFGIHSTGSGEMTIRPSNVSVFIGERK